MMKSQAELHSQAQAFRRGLSRVARSAPEQLIRNSALARENFDLEWQIQRAIDERKPLDEFAALGIVRAG